MKTTRRIFITGALLAGAGKAVDVFTDGDTSIVLIPTGLSPFMVGVRSPVECDSFKVEVFYHTQSVHGTLLLSQESSAPSAGNKGYGATNRLFDCPRDQVQFVRVTFLKELGKREIKMGSTKA